MATMICGSIIGATIREPIGCIQARPLRVTASALNVPSNIDSAEVSVPITTLFHPASSQRGSSHNARYQRSTSSVGGNAR